MAHAAPGPDEWVRIASEAFRLPGALRARRLPGDVETNVRITGSPAGDVVLRLFTSGQGPEAIRFRHRMIEHAAARDAALGERLPRPLTTGTGDTVARVSCGGVELSASAEAWIEGRLWSRVRPQSRALLREIGATLGALDVALEGFEDEQPPAALPPGEPSWRLADARAEVEARIGAVQASSDRRGLLEPILRRVRDHVEPRLAELPVGFVHQDANENNVIVRDAPGGQSVAGLIDFGDATRTWLVAEPAIAAAYAAFGKRDPLTAMGHVVAGYHGARPLTAVEFEVLFDLARLRLAASVAISASRAAAAGDAVQDYHLVSQGPAWAALEALAGVHPRFASMTFRAMAGEDPSPRTARFAAWARSRAFAPVLDAPLGDAPRVDLSVGSPFLVGPGGVDLPMESWGAEVERLRASAGAPAVIGHHGEARQLYAGSEAFAEPREDGDEPRTVHIGVDLFAPAGTEVRAPLDGAILSVQRNDAPFDYGPTVILEHAPEGADVFWTLHGHLDGEVLGRLSPGDRVAAGEAFARLGAEHENGGWPPHLHLQVILDRLDLRGDFPGVAAPSRRDVWMAISPDPAPLLGLDSCAAPGAPAEELLAARRAHFCSSMSISYREPLHMVKGRGAVLIDGLGRRFLDAVNNVPHVGHCHPRVVRAGQAQMGLLNTNTRYLSEGIVAYAEALRATLPPHLEVIYFVSSGSEANEVALRLARAATNGRRDVLVQERGYHGHTGNTVASSHYKFAGPGGFTPPESVHVVPLADPFRGLHRGPDSGPAYVAEVRAVLERMASDGRAPACLLAEAIIGCGGQVVPPAGYLAGAFDAVRDHGGVAIADEVQVGFGRVGTHMWAFQEQGARPDIVTMGKPIGNGHPMAAVATTRAIADAFAGGMEFFATFGGNNVSAAIGRAVLDVIEDEGLMDNARARGQQFFAGLSEAAERFPFVGDVRGRGLYLGVDLVRDPGTREPWGEAAEYVANRMRERGILISTDGPCHNVLKIKPPITFGEQEMERLVGALLETFGETPLQPEIP